MPAVLVTGPTGYSYAKLFLPMQRWPKPSPVLIAPTHAGMARLNGPATWMNNGTLDMPKVTNPNTNQTQCSCTLLM